MNVKLFVYNTETQIILAVITGEASAAQEAAEKFISEKNIESMFYKTYGYSPDSPEGQSYIRYGKKNNLTSPIGIRDGNFNSNVVRHPMCVEINL